MFENVQPAPPDPILGLTEAFKADTNPDKINLGVGVYKDANGTTPVLESVKAAEKTLLETEKTKAYLPIDGSPAYSDAIKALLFPASSPVVAEGRAVTLHAPSGTGALRVAGEYLASNHPESRIWMSTPTWPNHAPIFTAAGVAQEAYPYYDAQGQKLDIDAMLAALDGVKAGDVVLLHGCCHNPSGVDPTPEQWVAIADKLAEKKAVALLDFAYQGFGSGIDEDSVGLHTLAEKLPELIVCTSYSKNFSLYNERIGALTFVAPSADAAKAVLSQVKTVIRRMYSNPPAHGAGIVTTILNDASLRARWEVELAAMRERIQSMRSKLATGLDQRSVQLSATGNGFLTTQRGMFSFSGLNKDHVQKLRAEYAIYIVGSGRINVAGITDNNVDRLCDAIAAVTKN
ncbi:amino acid aminotransferase [Mucisphaera calidilacus]|uniref:Aminotransferase n=1 Tax=Mucisphaera calidilacus TaxID=2527982 RepID=A0A518BZ00_9BACT|nr:Aspartate aminotransferase [Mucisphaera calidilacus]